MIMTTVNIVNLLITTGSTSVTLPSLTILMFVVLIFVFMVIYFLTGCCCVKVSKIGILFLSFQGVIY